MSAIVISRIHRLLILALILAFLFATAMVSVPAPQVSALSASNDKIIVGYWHNFDNGSTNIRLRDVSLNFDIIQVAFAESTDGPYSGNMTFSPYNATENEFKSDIAYLQSLGKKVLISIGGANSTVELTTTQAKQNFVTTMTNLINTYGFDGLDIDLEGSSLSLNGGDTDFKNPTTPKIVNLISAIKEIIGDSGSDFVLTMAPETAYVQGGHTAYGGPWGAYLPVIYGLLNELDYLHVQHYNSGPLTALDGKSYSQGTADFQVAMAEMLLAGFPVAGDPNNMFPALRQDQVLIGLPASPQAAGGGYTSVANVQKALDYLIKGQSFGGSYVLQNPAGYPNMKGLMTWSINWDKYNNFEFSSNYRAYLDQFNGGQQDTTAPTVPGNLHSTNVTSNSVSLAWDASTDDVGVTGYTVSYGNSSVNVNGTQVTISGLLANTDYTFTVTARDAAGNVSGSSNAVTVTTALPPEDTIAPTVPTNLQVTHKSSTSVSLSWTASTDNVGVTGYTVSYGDNNVINVTGTTAIINGLSANTLYTFTVKAMDAAGNVSVGTSIQTTTDSSNGDGNACTYPAWNANTVYNGAERISYNGKVYEARWWTQGDQPDLSGAWGVWKYISDCSSDNGEGNDVTAPTAPSNLQVTSKSTSSVSLSWTASTDDTGVTGYTVSYGSILVHVTTTSATLNNLSANTSYIFTVTAKDAAGNVSVGTSIQTTTDSSEGGNDATAWAPGVSYKTNDEVTYNGSTYICQQNHTSLLGWEPSNVPALWKLN